MSEPPDDPAASGALLLHDDEALRRFCRDVAHVPVVALDIEANSLHAYRERACVLQATAGEASVIVDLLAVTSLDPLREALDRADVEIVFHGGDYDISLLSRDYGFAFRRVFDTMVAATLLGEPRVGLADLVREAYGVVLDKRFQKADWARRPLTPEQIDYLHRDTAYLPGLRDRLARRLEEADLVEEARIEFDRLAARRGQVVAFDPAGWRSIKGAGRVDALGRAVLDQLWRWRDRRAAAEDRPPFKVLPPSVLLDLALRPPDRLSEPRDMRAVPPALRRRYGGELLAALQEARALTDAGQAPAPEDRPRLSAAERAELKTLRQREDVLRSWRREEAGRRGVPNLVVLPNRALAWLVREMPASVSAIGACADVGPKRASRYGQELLDLLQTLREKEVRRGAQTGGVTDA